jgi:hypothetical protein
MMKNVQRLIKRKKINKQTQEQHIDYMKVESTILYPKK